MRWLESPREGGYLISDLAMYLGISEDYCMRVIDAAGVSLRIWCYDTGRIVYGSLSPEEATKVLHFFRLRKGMRLRA